MTSVNASYADTIGGNVPFFSHFHSSGSSCVDSVSFEVFLSFTSFKVTAVQDLTAPGLSQSTQFHKCR